MLTGGLKETDVTSCLVFVNRFNWNGDVDLNTGELQQSYEAYQLRLKFVSEIGLKSRQERNMILEDLKKLHTQLITDKDFAISGTHNTVLYDIMTLRLSVLTL